jgi:methyl-accepting chemotaxis protein
MPQTASVPRPAFRLKSIFVKATAIVALCAALVAGTITYLGSLAERELAMDRLVAMGGSLAELVGHQVGGALKFGKTEVAKSAAENLTEMTSGEVIEVLFLTMDRTIFYRHQSQGHPDMLPEMQAIANTLFGKIGALSPGQTLHHQDELFVDRELALFAHPIYFGADAEIVGVIVMRSDPNIILDRIQADQRTMLLKASLVFLAALIGASFVFRALVSTPLAGLTQSIDQVAAGDYGTTVVGTKATDEIGDIARAIEGFRDDLAASVETTRIGMFKGSGFEGASAALIVTDPAFNILFLNGAAKALLAAHFQHSTSRRQIEGSSVLELDPALRALPNLVQKGMPGRIGFSHGKEMLDLAFNAVTDAKGEQSGYVLEWRTTTQSRRNSAALSAMDATQLRGEFLPNGDLEEMNEKLAFALGLSPMDRGTSSGPGRNLKGQLDFAIGDSGSLWDKLAQGKPVNGLLKLSPPDGKAVLLSAQINPLLDENGRLRSYLLVGTDVTREQEVTLQAEEMRRALQAEQAMVVDHLRRALSKLSDGELTIRITQTFPTDYETLREDFNAAAERLSMTMGEVTENAAAIRGEVGDISSAAEQLSRRTEQQAATLEQTAAALDAMTASVKVSAQVATNANARAVHAKASADSSGKVVREAVAAMSDIEESSSKISRITSVIDEIAFQTNLLALNAGVEAARAGEAGRGFAVVATEVRELAQRSSAAAREIATLISASSDQVKRGVSLVAEAGLSLQGIEQAVDEIHGLVEDIASSSKEQSNGISELNTAVQHLDQVTQQNAAMFEETAAASQSLNRMADALSQTTQRFKIDATSFKTPKPQGRGTTASSWGEPVAKPKDKAAPVAYRAAPRAERMPAAQSNTALALQGNASGWEEF